MSARLSNRFTIVLVAAIIAAALALNPFATPVGADHQPANKVAAAAAIGEVEFLPAGEEKVVLRTRLKTSKPTELLLNVSAECSIMTDVTTVGDQDRTAHGRLSFRITISTDGGPERMVGVTQTSTGPNQSLDNDNGDAVFCDRAYRRVTSLGSDDQGDSIRTFMETRTANAFNWLALNVGSGIQDVRLYARFSQPDPPTGSTASPATGAVGNRTMIIEPVKAANDEHVQSLE